MFRIAGLAAVLCLLGIGALKADPVADFYHDKTVTMLIPSGVGGGFDLYARFLAQYIGPHIPGNPKIVVKNMPGAGGILEANNLFATVEPDGLTFGELQYTNVLNQLVKTSAIKFDIRKFVWLGSMDTSSTICAVSGAAINVRGEDLLRKQVLIGGSGGSTVMIPLLLNSLAGTRFKLVQGYVSTSNVVLAMQNGEVNGLCGWAWDGARVIAKQMLAKGVAKVALDIGTRPQAELKAMGVPFLMDLVPSGENKQVLQLLLNPQLYSRPFAFPPGTPVDRVKAMQAAFKATLSDPEFQSSAEKIGLEVDYMPPDEVESLVDSTFNAPARIQSRAAQELIKAGFKN